MSATSNEPKPGPSGVQTRSAPGLPTSNFFDEKTQVSNAKHSIVRKYLAAWLPKLSHNRCRTYTRIIYVDGFAGPGYYESGEEGSPVIALELALNHKNLNLHGPDINFIFIEYEKKKSDKLLSSLKKVKEDHTDAKNASMVKYMVIRGTFNEAINWIIKDIDFGIPDDYTDRVFQVPKELNINTKSTFVTQWTPILVFIDPFGYSGRKIPMTTMVDILKCSAKSEIILNLMTGFMGRFFEVEPLEEAFNLLIGKDEGDNTWKPIVLQEKTMKEKVKQFLELYIQTLSEGQYDRVYTCLFEMINQYNRLLYNLLFVSHHSVGFKTMKLAMRKTTQDHNTFRFSAYDIKKNPDLKPIEISIEILTRDILTHFSGKTVSGEDITDFINKSPVLVQTYKNKLKKSLQQYEKEESPAKKSRRFDSKSFSFPPVPPADEMELS